MKLGRDEVLMVPQIYFGISARSIQEWIQGGAKIGHGGPLFQKNFFFRPKGNINKPNAQQWSKSMWEQVLLFLAPFGIQNFDAFFEVFLDLVILVSFNEISIEFYLVKCFISFDFV